MRTKTFNLVLFIGIGFLTLGSEAALAKKMYRWVDDSGNVFFSDQVPPDQVQHKRETLSDKARVVDVLEKAKTPEEIAQQKRLEALRLEQEKIVAKQNANDKVLLSTFRTLDDMTKMLNNKTAALDAARKTIEGNIARVNQQLQQQQQQAAEHERNGQKVPDKLLKDISTTKQQIDLGKQDLARHLSEAENIEKDFKADMLRFQALTNKTASGEKTGSNALAISNAGNELGLFVCQDAAQCSQAWKIAAEFVASHSTTGTDVETDKLIMRAAPQKDDDLSLSASLLNQNNSLQIFLDIRCRQSSLGTELCASDKVRTIRKSFAPFIQSSLTTQQ